MAFTKGKSGNPNGRPQGAKSERTKEWEELRDTIITKHTERFNKLLTKMDDDEFKDTYIQILEYFKPKLNRTTLAGDTQEPINIIFKTVDKRSVSK